MAGFRVVPATPGATGAGAGAGVTPAGGSTVAPDAAAACAAAAPEANAAVCLGTADILSSLWHLPSHTTSKEARVSRPEQCLPANDRILPSHPLALRRCGEGREGLWHNFG